MAVGTHRDWSNLIPDVINLIAKKLPDVSDFICFRATCKSWRSSAPLSDSPTQCPWLLGDNMYSRNSSSPTTRLEFYSICSRQTYTVPIEGIQRFHAGPSYHYLPIINGNERTISFFNPLTKDKYVLPPIPGTDKIYRSWVVWTGINSPRDHSIVAVEFEFEFSLSNMEQDHWALYSPQNKQWTREQLFLISTVCYCQGMLFTSYSYPGCKTDIFDMASKKLLYRVPPPPDERPYVNTPKGEDSAILRWFHLVESSGKVFRVSSFSTDAKQSFMQYVSSLWTSFWTGTAKQNFKHYVFHIHKLDFDTASQQPRWVRVNNIGNQTIFLAQNYGFSIPAVPAAGFKENCIYFIDCDNGKPYVHDIAACTVEMLPCPLERCTWFVPGLS